MHLKLREVAGAHVLPDVLMVVLKTVVQIQVLVLNGLFQFQLHLEGIGHFQLVVRLCICGVLGRAVIELREAVRHDFYMTYVAIQEVLPIQHLHNYIFVRTLILRTLNRGNAIA